ncbi:MAG: hypothetical protein AAFR90_02525 [Pseudomonadota bacterium]
MLFWRRRNKKLDKRLNNVVEVADEVRKSYHSKPRRVIIDTSFVDQQALSGRQEQSSGQQPAVDGDVQHNSWKESAFEAVSVSGAQDELQPDTVHTAGLADVSRNGDENGIAQPDEVQNLDIQAASCHAKALAAATDTGLLTEAAKPEEQPDGDSTGTGTGTGARPQPIVRHAKVALHEDEGEDEGKKAESRIPQSDQGLATPASEGTALEIAELREAVKSLQHSLEEERAARMASAAEGRCEDAGAGEFAASELLSKIKEADARAQAAEDREHESQKREVETRREVLELRDKLEAMQQSRTAMFAEKDKLETALVSLNQEVAEKSEQLLELKSATQRTHRLERIVEEKSNGEKAVNQKLAAFEAEVTALRARSTKLEEELQESNGQLEAACDKIRTFEEQLLVADKRVVMADAGLKDAQEEIEMLRRSCDGESALRDKVDKLQEELRTAQSETQNLVQQLSKERDCNEAMSGQIASAREEIAVLQDQVLRQQSSAAEISRTSRLDAEARAAAETKANEFEAKLGNLQHEVDTEKSLNSSLRLELEQIRKKGAELQNRLAAATKAAEHSGQREAELIEQIAGLENELAVVKADARTAQAARARVDKEIQDLRGELEAAQKLARSRSAGQPANANEADLRFAADKPVFMKANKAAAAKPQNADQSVNSAPSASKDAAKTADRKSYKVSTSLAGTIQKDMELTVLSCRIMERSSDGARIDIVPDKFNASIGMPFVGDRLTLTIKTAFDTTTVPCEVVWLDGVHCELDFKGPPTTRAEKPKKSTAKTRNRGAEWRKAAWP